MQIIINSNIPFSVAEELIDNYQHFFGEATTVKEADLLESIGKGVAYVKKALSFLYYLSILKPKAEYVEIDEDVKNAIIERKLPSSVIIKRAIVKFMPFNEYCYLLQVGKTEKASARITIAKHNMQVQEEKLIQTFQNWLKYLDKDLVIKKNNKKVSSLPQKNQFFWFDEEGNFMFDEEGYTEKIVNNIEKNRINNQYFVDPIRLKQLIEIENKDFDLKKLICMCEEINSGYRLGNYCSVAVLIRACIDHVPPIFGKKNFSEVANNYGAKSFKDSMVNLDNFARKIADSIMHSHIRKSEVIPNPSTVDCKTVFDVLLGEIIVILKI